MASCFQTEDVGTGLALAAPPVLLSLAPLLVGSARRGVVGSSRYAKTLRESVRQAAGDGQRRAVFILGEPGLEKDNLAALIHFGSPQRKELMLRLDAALLKADGSDLFEPLEASDGRSLLELVGEGSLLIDHSTVPLRASNRSSWSCLRGGTASGDACSSPQRRSAPTWSGAAA